MERCPNCGQYGRPGAKFCTICGFKLRDDELASDPPDVMGGPESAAGVPESETVDTDATQSWPARPAPADAPEASAAWGAPARGWGTAMSDAGERDVNLGEPASRWAPESGSAWPAPPAGEHSAPESARPEASIELVPSTDEPVALARDQAEKDDLLPHPRERAERLLAELRDTIAALGDGNAPDLSGVISELEVAVTPPGAIDPDDLATLREALLAARERPRDLDTVVDLTNRIDAMVALVFAYDRTVAAIERSLEVLRRTQKPPDAATSSAAPR